MKWIAETDGLCLFFELSDELLAIISRNRAYHLDDVLRKKCWDSVGNNAHIFLLVHNGDTKRIRKYFRELLNKYDSVSFWDVGHKKFKIRRRKC